MKFNLCKTEIQTSTNNLVTEYMPNKVLIHVFMISSEKKPVRLIEWVKIALLFLHVMSKLFQKSWGESTLSYLKVPHFQETDFDNFG